MRVALTGFARAADMGSLEAALRERVDGIDTELEALRGAVRRWVILFRTGCTLACVVNGVEPACSGCGRYLMRGCASSG